MAPGEQKSRSAQTRQQERRDRYAQVAGQRLREAPGCQFALLPYHELVRISAGWYDACAEAMLRANFLPIDAWVGENARVAAEQGFELADLLELLRLCRGAAIEKEGWNEDLFAEVDTVIDEGLQALRTDVSWEIPAGLNYLTGESAADRERAARAAQAKQAAAAAEAGPGERRTHGRNKLRLPIRIKGFLSPGPVDERTRTENIARGGLYFISENPYFEGARLEIFYPYWETPDAINTSYPAAVVRVDRLQGHKRGVGVKFLVSLGGGSSGAG